MRPEPSKKIDQLAHEVIGAAIEVHRLLGPGYLENFYEEAMTVELNLRGISFERQKQLAVDYKGHPVGEGRLDLLVGSCLLVELKAVEALMPIHSAQVISYLKATRLPLGLLINFNVSVLKNGIKRVVLTQQANCREAKNFMGGIEKNSLGDLGDLAVQSMGGTK